MFRLRPANQLHALYTNSVFYALGMSFVDIFIYLYFFTLGFSVNQILVYLLIRSAWVLLATSLTGQAIARLGAKRVMAAGVLASAVFLLLLLSLDSGSSLGYLLAVVAAAEALSANLYWLGRMVYTAEVVTDKQSGQQLATMDILITIAVFIGPLAGGLLAQQYGFQWPTVLAFVCLLLAVVPLLTSPDPGLVRGRLRQRAMLSHFRLSWRNFAVEGIGGINYFAGTIMWGLYVAVFVLSDGSRFSGLGIIMAIVVAVSIPIAKAIGRLEDRGQGGRVLWWSVWSELALTIGRLFIKVPWQVVVHNIVQDQTKRGLHITLEKGSMHDSQSHPGLERIEYFILRETVSWALRSIFIALLAALALGLDWSEPAVFKVSFVAAGLLLPLLFLHHYSALRH